MPVIDVPQYSFSSGKLDDRLRSRMDLERVSAGCSELVNYYISLEGVAVRRPGTKYVDLSRPNARLKPFTRDSTNNFVLEFSAGAIRIIQNDYFLSDENGVIELTTPYSAADIARLKYCQNVDRMFFFVDTCPVMYLKRNSLTNWEFEKQEFVTSKLEPLFAAEGDYPACGTFFQQRFWMGGTLNQPQTVWGSKIGSYYDFSAKMLPGDNLLPTDDNWTFNPAEGVEYKAVTGSWKLNKAVGEIPSYWSYNLPSGTSLNDGYIWSTNSDGDLIYNIPVSAKEGNDCSNGKWRIQSSSQVNENYPYNVSNGSAVGNPWESATDFSSTGLGRAVLIFTCEDDFNCECVAISARGDDSRCGYPQDFTITAYDAGDNEIERIVKTDELYWTPSEERLYYFTKELEGLRKIKIEFTRIEVLQDTYRVAIGEVKFHPSSNIVDEEKATEDDYIEAELAGTSVNRIIFLHPFNNKLIVGTSGGIWSSETDIMTRSKVSFTPQTEDAPAEEGLLPINANNSMLFIMSGVNFAADFVYRLQYDDMTAENVSSFNRTDFIGKRVVAWAWQKYPENIVWVVFDDGSLYGLSYQKDQKLFAWHKHSTQGLFKDVCVISTNDGYDEVYFTVEREVNEQAVLYIEKLSDYSVAKDTAAFVDCHLRYDSDTEATKFSLAEHLAGEKCQVWAEDYFQDVDITESGEFDIDFARKHVVVGLGYESRLKTMQKEVQLETGSTIGRNRDVISARCILNNAVYARAGVGENLEELKIQDSTLDGNLQIVMNSEPEATGAYLDGTNSKVTICCDKPVPLEVLSLSIRINFV